MTELDEFDRKAKQFLEEGKTARIEDILREFAMCASYEQGKELDNPSRFLERTGLKNARIQDFTEYRVAKSVIKDHVKNGF